MTDAEEWEWREQPDQNDYDQRYEDSEDSNLDDTDEPDTNLEGKWRAHCLDLKGRHAETREQEHK